MEGEALFTSTNFRKSSVLPVSPRGSDGFTLPEDRNSGGNPIPPTEPGLGGGGVGGKDPEGSLQAKEQARLKKILNKKDFINWVSYSFRFDAIDRLRP
jgi:hypothetical protein